MKKYMLACAGLCLALTFVSCRSSESAYKKAYDKAKAQEARNAEPQVETPTPVVTPLETRPATQTTVIDNTDNVVVRSENFSVITGPALKAFGVVVGSFSLKANADGLTGTLKANGYTPSIVYNADRNMYRVVATSFDSKSDAARSRDQLRSTYEGAWLIFKK